MTFGKGRSSMMLWANVFDRARAVSSGSCADHTMWTADAKVEVTQDVG